MKKTRSNRRKNNMNPTKIGVIFIVSALALAGVGIGYSAWTDTIYIDGTVSSGSVEWHFIDYSGTYVWKVYGAPDTGYGLETVVTSDPTYSVDPANGFRVAYAEAVEGLDDSHAIVTYDNLFPCIDFEADVVIEYDGTIPGKINAVGFYDLDTHPENYWPEEGDEVLIDWYTDLYIDIYDGEDLIVDNIDPALLMGYQLHYGYEIHIVMKIHLPQDDTLMGLSGNFGVFAEVVQWNEYPYTGGGCGEQTFHKADLMLVLDTSGSISEDIELPLLRDAANAFITAIHQDDSITGQTQFQTNGWLDLHLTNIEANAHTAINDIISTDGWTNLYEGLDFAYDELMLGTYDVTLEPNSEGDRVPDAEFPDYIIVITDGATNRPEGGTAAYPLDVAKGVADACDTAGITIYVVGVGVSTAPVPPPYTGTYEDFLETHIASTPGHYYGVADFGDLATVLENIVNPP